MPTLKNTKHELFAQALAKGESITDSYKAAGFSPRGAGQGGHRLLLKNVEIQDRVDEIKRRVAERTIITLAGLTQDLLDEREVARRMRQPGVARQCTKDIAELNGLLTDKRRNDLDPLRDVSKEAALDELDRLAAWRKAEGLAAKAVTASSGRVKKAA